MRFVAVMEGASRFQGRLECAALGPPAHGFVNFDGRIERKEISPPLPETHPVADIGVAQKAFGEKGQIGRIVLQVG
jgi:hypothetical protein